MYFVLDFGGTNFRISWTNSLKEIDITANTCKIKNTGNYKKDSDRVINIMKSRSIEADEIVIALPGQFNHEKTVLDYANNLKTWVGKPFLKLLKSEFNCRVFVSKDSFVAAIGEGFNNTLCENEFLYITWGTGIGGCIVTTQAEHLPKITTLNWESTFRQIETLCSGGHAITNFGVELKYLNYAHWNILIENFVNEVEIICNKLKIRSIMLGGGITAKRGDIVSIIQKELTQRNIELVKSNLGDFSAIHGGYALLHSYLNDTDKCHLKNNNIYCLSHQRSVKFYRTKLK